VFVARAANLDEGASFGPRGMGNESAIAQTLAAQYPHLTNASIGKILELYPDDPSAGCPYNTGDGILSTGAQDKRALSIWGDITMHAGVRHFPPSPENCMHTGTNGAVRV
jgi:acetylcholinesterase